MAMVKAVLSGRETVMGCQLPVNAGQEQTLKTPFDISWESAGVARFSWIR